MNAIDWIISKAKDITIDDNMPELFFQGTIPSNMKSQLMSEIRDLSATHRDGGKTSIYNASIESLSMTFTFGAYKSTQNTVKVMFTDYTIYDNNPELWQG
jgi:hypothetical protein